MRQLALASIAAALCAPLPAAAAYVSVDVELVNVRKGPGVDEPVLWKSWRHTPFEILEWGMTWARVRDFEGDEGWVHRELLSSRPCVIVAAKRANLREGPGTNFDVRYRLERGYPLRVIGRDGNWLQVMDDDAVGGWIVERLVWGDASSSRIEA